MDYSILSKLTTDEPKLLLGRETGSAFGYSAYVDADTMVVGSQAQDLDSNWEKKVVDSGAAYVFTRVGTVWSLQQKLTATGENSRLASDNFGQFVVLHGDTVAVCAYSHDYDENGSNSLSDAGAVYVFTRVGTVWSQQQKLVATGTNSRFSSDRFGCSIGLYSDTLVSGLYYHSYDANGANSLNAAGACFVYTRSGGVWSLQQKLVGSGTNGRNMYDYFGRFVSLHNNTLVASASGQDFDANGSVSLDGAGAAYVFTRSGTVWSLQQKLVGSGTNGRISGDFFGSSVGVMSDTAVMGAYYQPYDGSGANSVYRVGAAYIFTRSGTVWSQQQKLAGSGTNSRLSSDNFGLISYIYNDTVVVGSSEHSYDENGSNSVTYAGALYVFTRSGTLWSQQRKLVGTGVNGRNSMDRFGSKTLGLYGETVVVGSNNAYDNNGSNSLTSAGAAYVFTRSGTSWDLQQKLVENLTYSRPPDYFGTEISVDGDTIIVGAEKQCLDASGLNSMMDAGAAYIFTRSGVSWLQQAKLVGTGVNGRNISDGFGFGVSVHGDTAVVGAYNNAYDENGSNSMIYAGAAYVFTRSGTVWSQQQKLVGTGVNGRGTYDNFGISVGAYNDTIVVGARGNVYNASGSSSIYNAGACYIFTRNGTVWSLQQKLVGTGVNGRNSNDLFGQNVHINGETVIVGAISNSYDANGSNSVGGAGAAYVFTRSGTVWSQQQKLTATGVNSRIFNDSLGILVKVYSNTAILGSFNHAYDENGSNVVSWAGACFVFTRNGTVWSQQQKLVGTNRSMYDGFGFRADIYDDMLIAGSNNSYDEDGLNSVSYAGAAYVFSRSGTLWSLQQKLIATGTNNRHDNNLFSSTVAIDNNKIVVGAYFDGYNYNGSDYGKNAGAIYILANGIRYWVGSSSNWWDVNNWSETSGGLGGVSVPDGVNLVIFDGHGNSCTLARNVSITHMFVGNNIIDANGYRISCGSLSMGTDGKIYFRNGSHYIGDLNCCSGGEIDWGTGYIGVTGNLDLRNISATNIGVYKNGFAHIELNGVADQEVYGGGQILPILEVIKPSGTVTFKDDIACRQLNNLEGTIVGTTIYDIFDFMTGVYP